MKKSLYKKFYITFLTVALAGFFLLGSIVLAFSGNYFMGQNKTRLLSQSQTVAAQIQQGALQLNNHRLSQYTAQLAAMFSDATNTQILVVNTKGEPVANTGVTLQKPTVATENLTPYRTQSSVFSGNLGGVLQGNCAIAAVPVTVGGQWAGVVYSILPLGTLGGFLWDLLQLLLIAAFLTAILVAFGAYFMASALVRPLSQMSKAAKCLARGDFSQRIANNREDEIGQLAEAFNQMTLSLEAGEKMRHGFVANVSHELKTPMTTISGFV
ncbi:MAG: HAMP domain-containing protein, partial [Clostridia bacterium]|nr:HAMP domain-containing protein [Clostridia bacterium]